MILIEEKTFFFFFLLIVCLWFALLKRSQVLYSKKEKKSIQNARVCLLVCENHRSYNGYYSSTSKCILKLIQLLLRDKTFQILT